MPPRLTCQLYMFFDASNNVLNEWGSEIASEREKKNDIAEQKTSQNVKFQWEY